MFHVSLGGETSKIFVCFTSKLEAMIPILTSTFFNRVAQQPTRNDSKGRRQISTTKLVSSLVKYVPSYFRKLRVH